MEQASGSIMTAVYVRSLPICLSLLCCGHLLLFGSWSTLLAIAFQVNAGVSYFLDYVEDIYDRWWSSLSRCMVQWRHYYRILLLP